MSIGIKVEHLVVHVHTQNDLAELFIKCPYDTAKSQELPRAIMDPLELPLGPITRAWSKRLKDATTSLVDRVWGKTVAGLLESSWTSKPSKPCNLLQAQPAQP
ncbi:hypothetical protein PVK06_046797 [Gossypium arboreum]|uniref:Uncharacterized protein n=1 Tax=Gossypium arboreum TaxID=29729 RepID=A0ABR0ME72_GOSAR|nr:hypothetical protein PVK06_046797 [Gossypium arboreum]